MSSTKFFRIVAGVIVSALLLACAWYAETDNDVHRVFPQEVMGATRFQPFFFTVDSTYYAYDDKDSIYNERLANVNEWKKYFKDVPSKDDIVKLIYSSTLSNFGNGRMGNDSLERYFKNNSCYQAIKTTKDQEALAYICTAKQCEPLVTNHITEVAWDAVLPPIDTLKAAKLMIACEQAIKKTKSPIIQLRYAYQLVRLANYSFRFKDCINYYDTYIEPNKTKSAIRYWSLSLKARALYKLNRWAESEYCYAMVFDRCNTRRHLAKQGFNWAVEYGGGTMYYNQRESDTTSPLQYCKDNLEKIPVYALLAVQSSDYEYANIYERPELLDSIYRIDPKSEMLEWLMVRGVSQLERATLAGTSPWIDHSYQNDDWGSKRNPGKKFSEFVNKWAIEGKTRQPQVCSFAAAYASYCVGDTVSSLDLIAITKQRGDMPPMIAHHVELLHVLMKITNTKKADVAFEASTAKSMDALYGYGKSKKVNEELSLVWLKLAEVYKHQGDTMKTMLCYARSLQGYDPWNIHDEATVNKLLAFLSKPNKTPFESMLAASYTANILEDVKGTIQLTAHQWQDAINTYSISHTGLRILPADPFLIHRKDCHDCDYEHPLPTPYTRLALAKKMKELETLANTKGPEQARNCYLYANGLYNMTRYGNTWMATNVTGSEEEDTRDGADQLNDERYVPEHYYDCVPAMEYYKKALSLAGKDQEFAAECCFMIAKCKLNEHYNATASFDDDGEQSESKNPQFAIFKKDYSNTQYYNDVVNECSYFRYYLAHYAGK